MYPGRKQRVKLQFIPPLLDAMIERFGTTYAQYGKPDGRHYTVEAEVDISDQFYGWLLGFDKKVKLMYLLAYDPESESIRNYRVDRMASLGSTGKPRVGILLNLTLFCIEEEKM